MARPTMRPAEGESSDRAVGGGRDRCCGRGGGSGSGRPGPGVRCGTLATPMRTASVRSAIL